jgi:hypothetical protein
MGPLAHAFRPSELTLGRPPCSFMPSLGDVVPLVPVLIMYIYMSHLILWLNRMLIVCVHMNQVYTHTL